MKKFELTANSKMHLGKKLFQIKALISFGNVEEGDLGGFIEKEDNLSQYGDAWVYGNARVYGNAEVSGNARVSGNAWVSGNEDYTTIKGFGRNCRNTTFFKSEDGDVKVVCGCFYGTLDEFRKKVKETHGDSKYATEYLMIADLMELHFKED